MRRLVLLFAVLSITAVHRLQAQHVAEVNIFYDGARQVPLRKELARLDSLLGTIDPSWIREITVVGHTDSIGGRASNAVLADKRAMSMRALLLERGLRDELITVHSFGALVPIAENITASGRARNRRVFVRVEYQAPVDPDEPLGSCLRPCDEDTVIVVDSTLRFRAKKCQRIECLSGARPLTFDEFVSSDLRTTTAYGQQLVVCGAYQVCDTGLVFDPPLRVEVFVPPGITAAAARDLFGLFGGDGRWLGHDSQNVKVRLKHEKGKTIAVFSVYHLTRYFSVCCGGIKKNKKIRIRFKSTDDIAQVTLHSGGLMSGSAMKRKGKNLWKAEIPCASTYTLKVVVNRSDGTRAIVYPDLKQLDHRVQLFGRKCARLETKGKPLLGMIPMRDRALHRTYRIDDL